jgi:hypothetical protein
VARTPARVPLALFRGFRSLADIVVPMRAGAIGHAIAFAPGNDESEEGEQIDKAQARA